MASALVYPMCIFIAFVGISAMPEITPSRLFIKRGEVESIKCSLKLQADKSCYRPINWYFVNTTEHETRVASIDSVAFGPYMDHFQVSYHESSTPTNDFKKCNYYLNIANATARLDGSYRCKLNRQMSDWASVVVLPEAGEIQPECSVRVTNITHVIQDVEMLCKAFPVDPLEPDIRLAWLYQDQRIPYRNTTSAVGLLTTKAQLTPRNESSNTMEFTCQSYDSRDNSLANSCTITCEVDISLHGAMTDESGRTQGTYQCPFMISLGGIRYNRQWIYDGEPINLVNQTDRFIAEDRTGTLHMTEILPSDYGKTLTCVVDTMFGVYTAKTLITWGDAPTRAPKGVVPLPFPLSTSMLVIIVVGVALLVIINACVCLVVIKSRGKRSRTMNQANATSSEQDEGLYASGIIPFDGYLHMNGTYTGSYNPEDPYEAMAAEDGTKRDSGYQVPRVNVDGTPIKKKQTVKYMNTMGGAKNRGFLFRFSRRKEEKHVAKSEDDGGLGGGACSGGAMGLGPPPLSPNCYDDPKYNCESSLKAPQFQTPENDYDELKLKSESEDES